MVICDTGSATFRIEDENSMLEYYKGMNPELVSLDVGVVFMTLSLILIEYPPLWTVNGYKKRGSNGFLR